MTKKLANPGAPFKKRVALRRTRFLKNCYPCATLALLACQAGTAYGDYPGPAGKDTLWCPECWSAPIGIGAGILAGVLLGLLFALRAPAGAGLQWRRQSRKPWHARDAFLADALRAIGEGVICCDVESRVISLNPAAEKLTGWSSEDARGRPFSQIFHAVHTETRIHLENPVEGAVGNGKMAQVKDLATLIARNGSEHPVRFCCAPICDAAGNTTGAVVTVSDASEAYLHRQALLEEAENFRLFMKHSISAIATHEIMLDQEGRPANYTFLSANPAFEAHTGLKTEDIVGRRITEVLPGIEHDHFIETYGEVVLTGQARIFEQYSEQLDRHYLIHAFRLQERRFATSFTDISESKRTEREMTHQSYLITSLIDSIPDLISVKDINGMYLSCNPQFAAFVGRPKHDIIGKTDYDLFDRSLAELARYHDRCMLESARPQQNEEWITYPDGRKVLLDTLKTPFRGADGQVIGIIGISRDITERKQTEKALEKRLVALTRPLNDASDLTFADLFNLDDLQQLQEAFARATGVASIITRPDGTPITKPSNFCRICREIICKTFEGRAKCFHSNAVLGQPSDEGPTIHKCLSAGLWEAGSAILVGGHHIANWLVGQVRDPMHTEDQIRAYARQIGADETAAIEAFREAPVMSRAQFEQVANALYSLAKHLSLLAYQNLQQARFITEQKNAQGKIAYLAHYDQLTGLANRALLAERFEQAARQAMPARRNLALCLLDLDGFKAVNDVYGHHVGDQLLCEIAKRLKDTVRASDVVSRLGGDEFLILFTDMRETIATTALIQKIMTCLASPFDLEGHVHTISASMGVAIFPEDGRDLSTLFKHADAAMYFAKESGRNNVQFFHREISQQVENRLELERELRQALTSRQLELHYQPIWRLTEKRIVGMEALVRWRHPEKGMISPGCFIPIAEESNLIMALGQWVLETACRDMADWAQQGFQALPVAVNVSAKQLFQKDFASFVRQVLQDHALPPHHLELEVTESIFLESHSSVEEVMDELKAIGIGLALDDFGTGYSSLSYLNRFHIDKLKIDRSFMEHICQNEQDAILAATIIRMAQSLGMEVVAEGVENTFQEQFLVEQGCDLVQGFFYCKPQPLDAIRELFIIQGADTPSSNNR